MGVNVENVPVPNIETILKLLTTDLRERRAGYRLGIGFQHLVEESDTLRMVNLTLYVLENCGRVGAFQTDIRVKLLSDPSPEQKTVSEWRIGTLEDAAKAVCTGLSHE